jgi:hypothetical protein
LQFAQIPHNVEFRNASGTRLLVLTTLVWPDELLRMVTEVLALDA